MRYRSPGDSGLMVSVAGLGCNNFGRRVDLAGTRAVVDAAMDARHHDARYRRHLRRRWRIGGTARRGAGSAAGSRWCWPPSSATRATTWATARRRAPRAAAPTSARAVEASLRLLRTDYIDLYQLHTPDPVTPVAETLAALTELVTEGKVRYLGNSNFTGWQIADAAHVARVAGTAPFVSAQNHWSLLEREAEAEVLPPARHFGLGVLPYFPLANGLLTGKVRRGQPPPAGNAGWPVSRAT